MGKEIKSSKRKCNSALCGKEFWDGSGRRRFCEECKKLNDRERQRKYKQKKKEQENENSKKCE